MRHLICGDGLHQPVQEKAIREWAKSVGHQMVRWKREEGESGSNGPDTREGRTGGLSAGRRRRSRRR